MNSSEDESFSPTPQSATTPLVQDPTDRSHAEKIRMMNSTPNGYNSVPNHKPKPDGQILNQKHHESSSKHSESSKHSSDHLKPKDPSKHSHSSHSKSENSEKSSSHKSNDVSKHKEHGHDKEKKHSSSKHMNSEHSKHEGLKNGTDKIKSEDKIKKHKSSDGSHKHSSDVKKSDKIREDKPKDKSKSEHSSEHKKPKDGKEHDKHKVSKDKVKIEGSKDKHHEKVKDKSKEKHEDKPKDKHSDKHKSEKHKDKSEKPLDKSNEAIKIKIERASPEKKEHKKAEESFKTTTIKQEPISPVKSYKEESLSEDDMPLSARKLTKDSKPKPVKKSYAEESSEDDEPISNRINKAKKIKTEDSGKKKRKADDDEDFNDSKPKKKIKKEKPDKPKKKEKDSTDAATPKKRGKKEEEQEVWKWWEEEKKEDGVKWKTLEHNGPVFAPLYDRVPKSVKFYYDGKHMELSELTEEVAGFYGRMLDHEYTTKDSFNTNFFKDWRKVMTSEEKDIIKDLKKCNFNAFNEYYKQQSEQRKNMTKEEKLEIKKQNEELVQKFGFCIVDGHKQKIGNFKIEPPGLFRGRGEHPKMGMLKRRVQPEDVTINIGKEAKVPDPPAGHKWKKVLHDNKVTWLASWNENILNSTKYIMLNPSSKLKGEKDWQKYETARKLKNYADQIRETYQNDFKSKEMRVRQRAVALYFIDKLALRAGNEKDEDTADTVGCCSLRVEHITLDEEKDGQEYVVSFDFLGKDCIRYVNSVPVEKRAFKNLKLFMENKQPGDDLFDRLNTTILNKYLNELMEGLTAKVFRTYNASKTLQEQLDLLTKEEMSIPEKMLAYNRANRAVAVLCNHQRAVPKTFSKSMENLKAKMDEKNAQIREVKKELKQAKADAKNSGSAKDKMTLDKKKKRLKQLEEQLKKLEVQATDKEENKQIALGTSKLNYLDPRISVAWCKKWDVPIEKIYNRTQRDKFRWAIEMAGPDFVF